MIIIGKYKVVNEKRFKKFIFITVFTLSLIIFSLMMTIKAYPKDEVLYEYVCVKSGDTLWDIAGEYNNHIDIRKFINMIIEENSLNDLIIYPGDILKIPLNL